MKKRYLFAALLAVLCLVSVLLMPVDAQAATYSGTCGSDVTWSLNTSTGVLTISGTGRMYGYSYFDGIYPPWYSYRVNIKKIVIDSGVTNIGNYAFVYCENLTSIAISDTVTMIGDYAFYECTALPSVTIPASVTNIEDLAFHNCTSLAKVTFAENSQLAYIGDYAFCSCENLSDITLPNSVTTIANFAFGHCNSLTTINIPTSLVSIGSRAFYFCRALTTIAIPDNVTSIEEEAFNGCEKLSNITFSENSQLTSIGLRAFSGCESLTSISLPNRLESIGESAFANCSGLSSLVIPDSVKSLGKAAFKQCTGLTAVTIGDGLASISEEAFCYCYALASVNFGANSKLTTIGRAAFSSCYHLTDVVIPDSVTSIGQAAFGSCSSLTDVVIPDSVTSIGLGAFSGCYDLVEIAIPDGVISIGNTAFSSCYNLKRVTFGANSKLTTIGDSAFSGCSSLAGIALPDSVTHIGKDAFCTCFELEYVTIGENSQLRSIGDGAFSYCYELANITIPKNVTAIGTEAFTHGSSLVQITFLGDAPTIGDNAFYYVEATAYYPAGNSTWTADVMQNYGGTITWVGKCNHNWLDATCTAPKTCSNCGATEGDALDHDLTQHESKEATCTEDGWKAYENCSRCDYTTYEAILAEGHVWGEWYTVDEASCASEGMEQRDCDACDSFETNTLPMKDHSYESVVTAPTCTEQGYTTYTCSGCADAYVADQVAATGHNYTSTVTLPTCTEAGYTTYTCAACGDEYQDDHVEATGHNYGDWFVENPATCTEKGNERRECQNCDHFETAELAAAGHTEVVDAAVEALCTATGLTEGKHCQVCEEILVVQNIIPALGHTDADKDYVCDVCGAELCVEHKEEVIQGKAPTCLYDGLTDGKRCATCGDILKAQEVIPALGHTWEAATCDTAKTCTVCAATEGEALGHHYGDWTQVKVPTTEETGLEERVCTNCGNKEQREVDKMEPAPTEPKPTEPAQTQPVQTAPVGGDAVEQEQGERGNSTLWIAVICGLGGVALGVFVMLIVLMKKKEK